MAAVLLGGALLRVVGVDRPLDHRLANAWRASDYTQIARNFHREGLNPFYPRIDWRGDTPGFVEMEFPMLPWLAAVCDRAFGYHEAYMRIFAAAFSVAALWLFSRLALLLLPAGCAVFATTAFALNPLLVRLGNAMQPEPAMIFFSILCMYQLERWRREPRGAGLLLTACWLACAALAKPPAAILGLVVLAVVAGVQGRRAFTRPLNYVAAAIAALPTLGWVLWSRHFWIEYENSLGVSNESHWLSLRILASPWFVLGNLRWETLAVWTPLGWLLAFFAVRAKLAQSAMAWTWYVAVCLLYLAAAGTSGDDWASYYHCASVAPACLLMGAGLSFLIQSPNRQAGETYFDDAPHAHRRAPVGPRLNGRRRTLAFWMAGGVIASLFIVTCFTLYRRDHQDDLFRMRQCAVEMAALVPADTRIVVRGGEKFDEYGRPVAFNEPMMFAWMDRKGFNYARSDLSIDTLNAIARRGGRYWIARAGELRRDQTLRESADRLYRRVANCTCGAYVIYDLHPASTER